MRPCLHSPLFFLLFQIDAQISYEAVLGNDIRFLHGARGVVISKYALIEDRQTIFHGVTIGINEGFDESSRVIHIHENCYFSAGCVVISCEIGANSKIGPNAVVWRDIPENSVYVAENNLKHEKY